MGKDDATPSALFLIIAPRGIEIVTIVTAKQRKIIL